MTNAPRLAFVSVGHACCTVLDGTLVLSAEADDSPSMVRAVKRTARNLKGVIAEPAAEIEISDEDEAAMDWDDLVQILIDTDRISGPITTHDIFVPRERKVCVKTDFYDHESQTWTPAMITIDGSLTVTIDGYGDHCSDSDAGERPVIKAEVFDGVARCVVWGDINQEDPTHNIHLDDARLY